MSTHQPKPGHRWPRLEDFVREDDPRPPPPFPVDELRAIVNDRAPHLLSSSIDIRERAFEELTAEGKHEHENWSGFEDRFKACFLALHLPEFVRVWREHMDVSVDLASRTSGYACLLVDLPLFRRWVRENDQEAVDLLGAFLVWFDKACVHPPEAHALLPGNPMPKGTSLVLAQAEVVKVLMSHLPLVCDGQTLPVFFASHTLNPTAAIHSLLAKLDTLFASLRRRKLCIHETLWGAFDGIPSSGNFTERFTRGILCPEHGGIEMLALLSDGRSTVGAAKWLAVQDGALVSWEMCEAKHALETTCVQVDGEMMACGRCTSVRYCSKTHQRGHWKEHRDQCFTPVWAEKP